MLGEDKRRSSDERCHTWATQLVAAEALEDVLTAFERQGIEALPVKGIVTARTLYADPADRPIRDVDVRIKPGDFFHARRVVQEEGWQVARELIAYRNLIFTVRGVDVDLEAYVGPPCLSGLSVEEMLARAIVRRDVSGRERREPEVHDHAVLLCLNVFKDKIVHTAPWALDDVERIVRHQEFDADAFVDRVTRAKLCTAVWIVADWMTRERSDARWAEVRTKLGGDRGSRRRYSRAFFYLQSRPGTHSQSALRVLARLGSDSTARNAQALIVAIALEIEMRIRTVAEIGRTRP